MLPHILTRFFPSSPTRAGQDCGLVDACATSPCANGARCANWNSQYNCSCPPGFQGKNCRSDVDECRKPGLCLNAGLCINNHGSYRCQCPPGYSGRACEVATLPCAPSQCLNGGTCRQTSDHTYECACLPGFAGHNCENNVDDCPGHKCMNGGICVDGVNTYNCQCAPEWTGRNNHLYPVRNTSIMATPVPRGRDPSFCVLLQAFFHPNYFFIYIYIFLLFWWAMSTGGSVNTIMADERKPIPSGQYCVEDVNECLMQPNACHNGGTCFNTIGGHTCVCVNGWTGDDCSENIDDCAIAVCFNGATCHDRVASFFCECPVGKTGLLCHLDDACVSNPCNEGAVCDTNPLNGRAICTCPAGFVGGACNQDMDECSIGECFRWNDATCLDRIGEFTCICMPGTLLLRCMRSVLPRNLCQELSIDVPCLLATICLSCLFFCVLNFHNPYVPPAGYMGTYCEVDVDDCESNPCANDGHCRDMVNGFTCKCQPGFTGTMCQIDVDECASTPCQNGAKCYDRPNGYECRCAEGYEGTLCESNINNCQPDPCHHGTCMDGIASYTCQCDAGYTGYRCENQLNECHSNPCQNGGKCVDLENGFHCMCPVGFKPPYCYSQVDECGSGPCLHGICRDDINGYAEENVNVNECSSSPCLNKGLCVDGVASFTCLCELPYSGPTCADVLTPCSPNPCDNHALCSHTADYQGYQCNCQTGWQGQMCNIDVNECISNPCKNRGACTNTMGGFMCSCRAGYHGLICETDVDDCSPSELKMNWGEGVGGVCTSKFLNSRETLVNKIFEFPVWDDQRHASYVSLFSPLKLKRLSLPTLSLDPCLSGGSCKDSINSFQCSCLPGFTGPSCAMEVNECQSSPCKNGGSCTDYVNSYTCSCRPGFTGIHCETNIQDCTESSCFNGGTCTDKINGYSCTCRNGFTGSHCQYEVNECDSQPCLNGGLCQDALESFRCTCPKGHTGNRCQTPVDWCRRSSPCQNGGRCRQKDASFSCDCAGSWSGRYCDIPRVSCESAARQRGLQTDELCQHEGHCVNTGNTHYCKCHGDFTGSYCESPVDYCEDKPCRNGATCRGFVGRYRCECMPGFTGETCEMEENECESHPCQNGGTCIDLVGHYICSCPPGTLGVLCEINEDDCAPPSRMRAAPPKCLNNGTCVDRVGGHRCNCPPGFTGERCEGDINECLSSPCSPANSLDCIQLPNDYQCVCKPGFTGRRCQSRFSVCESQPCQNGGACTVASNSAMGYTCTCQLGYVGAACERSMSCRELSCYNGGNCALTARGARCTCQPGFAGPQCQHRSNEGCSSQPCRNAGLCTEETSFPFFHCQCPAGWGGKRCEQSGSSKPRELPAPACPLAECHGKANNSVCDKECNQFACRWDGGDCSLAVNPWARCPDPRCWRVFNNSQCDESCNNADCLYDNFDCKVKEKVCNPIYETYCIDHYADGRCDQGCNSEECGWDGLDCAADVKEDLAEDLLVVVVLLPPEELRRSSTIFLQKLSAILRTTVRFRLDRNGEAMIRPYTRPGARYRRELERQEEGSSALTLTVCPRGRCRSVVYLEIDNRLGCEQGGCFRTADGAADYLGALSAWEMLRDFPYQLKTVSTTPALSEPDYPQWAKLILVGVASLFLFVILVVGMLIARRKREHSTLWFPEGFFPKKEPSSNKNRREPVGQDALGMKHMPKTVEESLLGDHSDQWMDADCPEIKRLKEPSMMSDHEDAVDSRQWTQHHLAAADIRVPPTMALTPPQGEFDSDCMDVNVRGPDGFTPLMLASFCGGGLEPEIPEEEESEECSANIISDLIYQGASLAAQTDRTGETALHLAARYARADAAKRLLDAGADANAQDNTGRSPLHAAVAADAQGVFQILIRTRATDLDSRMYDGSTALILAARMAVEGMVEELITCHADVNAVDELGKSALHWAAAVNNVDATIALLKNGANKDMQDLKEETPLFLAAREGSCEAVKVLLAHFANREITDHMDRLPRDIAQERMHHDIVQLLDEYNTVRSPQGHGGGGHHLAGGHTLSPLMCPPSAFLPSLKTTPQGKKNRRPGAKGTGPAGQHAAALKESAKARSKKLTLDMQSALLESSVTLSPVDSLDSPRGGASNAGYITNPTSPAAMASPGLFHTSMSVPNTPMVHAGMMEGGGPFAVSLAQLNDLGDGGMSMQGRVSMAGGLNHGYVLNAGPMGINMGMVSPVSVPFDWHSRMTPSSQCGQQVVNLVHTSQAGMHPQSPAMQQQQQQQQQSMLLHQQMYRNQMLQPTPVTSTPTISPVKLPSIAEQQQQQHQQQQQQQQQLLNHSMVSQQSMGRMTTSTPPTPQTSQPPPAFFQQQQQQPPQSQAGPQMAQAAAPAVLAAQMPPSQAGSSTVGLDDYPTPPSQHSYSSALDATPKHYLHLPSEHPYLTPSPESPEPWSSPSPHCVSDWSDSTPSPAVAGPAQTQISHATEAGGKMQVFA
uniref:Notch receptor 3 n=1 Tax=Gadus morhua TaxID=8049 RepID=A0A8C5BWX1_GADMO